MRRPLVGVDLALGLGGGGRELMKCSGNISNNGWRRRLLTGATFVAATMVTVAFVMGAQGQPNLAELASPFHQIGPDAYLDPPEFIRSRQFVAETHRLVTRDNYILTLHRIINPLVPPHLRHQLKPVLLQHGLFTSSFNFIISSRQSQDRPRFDERDLHRTRPLWPEAPPLAATPLSLLQSLLDALNDLTLARWGLTEPSDVYRGAPEMSESLGFELANQAYDVWMVNSRGSTYSLNHTHLDHRHDWRYWDFSFHEIGLLDLPATIDYILERRPGRQSLAFVGHSQGNLAMFLLQSLQPEWAAKVKPFIALAPIAFIPDVYFGAMRTLVKLLSTVGVTPASLNGALKGQVVPKSRATEWALDLVCLPKWTSFVCDLALALIGGGNLKKTNKGLTPVVAHHIPEGTSLLNVLHFAQMIGSGQFGAFDFGARENGRRYGRPPGPAPLYPIGNIQSRDIAFVAGRTDTLSTMSNVAITRAHLRVPLMDDYVVPELVWGHSDFMYANGAGRLANAHMIGLIDRYRLVA